MCPGRILLEKTTNLLAARPCKSSRHGKETCKAAQSEECGHMIDCSYSVTVIVIIHTYARYELEQNTHTDTGVFFKLVNKQPLCYFLQSICIKKSSNYKHLPCCFLSFFCFYQLTFQNENIEDCDR